MNKTDKIAVIVGMTEAIKQFGVPSKFCPMLAILIGAILEYAQDPTTQALIQGAMLGATITGGYAVVKRAGNAVADAGPGTPVAAATPTLAKDEGPPFATGEHDDFRGVQ